MPVTDVTGAQVESGTLGRVPHAHGRFVPAAVGGALALPLLGYAAIGSFARYTADDYCWAGVLRTQGFLQAQVSWYTQYSPRYTFTFLVNLAELAGPAIVPALPAAAILVWLATLTWTFVQFKIELGQCSRTTSAVLLAEVAALASLQTAPDMAQSLYWQTGMLTYLLPLVLATFLVGWVRRALDQQPTKFWALGLSGLVTFVGGGLSETYLIPQNVGLTLALLACVLLAPRGSARRVASAHLLAALAGGVLALGAIVLAPATSNRVGGSPADLWLASSAAIATATYQVVRLARFFSVVILLCLGLPALIGTRPARIDSRWLLEVSAIVVITLPFCYFPSFYAQNGNPPARSLIVPGTLLIGYLLFVGYALRGLTNSISAPARAAIVLALVVAQLGVAATSLPQQALAAQQAAARWDATDQHIRASRDAGQSDIIVPPLPPYLGEDFVTSDPKNWFNVCVARYYGVESIAASPS
ncbi:MAG: DUF6056 family protein [Chloroflexota bacterium]|nr:DUF6056 family protein [Chloroflexota bacterium]